MMCYYIIISTGHKGKDLHTRVQLYGEMGGDQGILFFKG